MNIKDFASKKWRLNNLYRIINKDGLSVKFKMNPVQEDVLDSIHSRNLILKARQLGMSTFSVLYLIDEVACTSNLSAGIVSYSLEHAQHIFKRIVGHALDNLPDGLSIPIINRSAREITFENGSVLRVDTTLRGGAYQLVLVSEFGKICARNPLKAEEVMTGTLQTVPINGRIIIESTGEGSDGYFVDMINNSLLRGNDNLSPLNYKLFFYPWYKDSTYSLESKMSMPLDKNEYFDSLEKECDIKISQNQRKWYYQQYLLLGDKVKQEFPSTIKEAFLSNSDAYYFAEGIEKAYKENRCPENGAYDALLPVYVAMDIGVNDLTVIIFFQVIHGELRVIDFYADNGKGVDFYSRFLLQDKSYLYHTIFLPHDAQKRDGIVVENTYEREFKKLFSHTKTKFVVLKRTDKEIQISNAKIKLNRTVFAINKVKPLLDMMMKYRKRWSEQYGKYLDDPYHGIESNYADAFQYVCAGMNHIESTANLGDALVKHRQVVENRRSIF